MVSKGQWYETRKPIGVTVWLAISAPVSVFGERILPAGEMLVVTDPKVYGKVCCRPHHYSELEDHFISADERKSIGEAYRKYEGYYLLIPIETLEIDCERVVWEAPPQGQILMDWFHEPPSWKHEGNIITVTSAPSSDFWRKTHYGFIRDNGHFYHQTLSGDFTVEVKVSGQYRDLYDQAGVMVRLDETTWMKCGIEFVHGAQFASAVVTRDYSDWSVVPMVQNLESIWLRVKRTGGTLEVLYSTNGDNYAMLRMTYLTDADVQAGIMIASPDGSGFSATFEGLTFHSIHTAGEHV